MATIVRVGVLAFAVLTLIYIFVYLYLREGAKERAETDWVMAGRPGDRQNWIDARLRPWADRITRRLIVGVYVVPLTVLVLVIALTS